MEAILTKYSDIVVLPKKFTVMSYCGSFGSKTVIVKDSKENPVFICVNITAKASMVYEAECC